MFTSTTGPVAGCRRSRLGTLRRWGLEAQPAIDALCARTRSSLTEAVWFWYAGGIPYRAPCP